MPCTISPTSTGLPPVDGPTSPTAVSSNGTKHDRVFGQEYATKKYSLLGQLMACKSIDALVAEAEDPSRRLKKTLGPWSITALGIGAIIGSGILVHTGTAAAGAYYKAPSILHAQVMDLIIQAVHLESGLVTNGTAVMHGRPPAGPSIAVSFLVVAIVCSFAGLCYAELASMIPIAGSAYTYAYATLGEVGEILIFEKWSKFLFGLLQARNRPNQLQSDQYTPF